MSRAQPFYEAYLSAMRHGRYDPCAYVPGAPLYNDGNGFRAPTDAEWVMVRIAIAFDSIANEAKMELSRLAAETSARIRSIECSMHD